MLAHENSTVEHFQVYVREEIRDLQWERHPRHGWLCRGLVWEGTRPKVSSVKEIDRLETEAGYVEPLDHDGGSSDNGGSDGSVEISQDYRAGWDAGFAEGLAKGIKEGKDLALLEAFERGFLLAQSCESRSASKVTTEEAADGEAAEAGNLTSKPPDWYQLGSEAWCGMSKAERKMAHKLHHQTPSASSSGQ